MATQEQADRTDSDWGSVPEQAGQTDSDWGSVPEQVGQTEYLMQHLINEEQNVNSVPIAGKQDQMRAAWVEPVGRHTTTDAGFNAGRPYCCKAFALLLLNL